MMRRRLLQKQQGVLPSAYRAVQYIQAIQNTHFDSGYVPTIAPRIETRIQVMTTTDADLFGFVNNTFPSFIVDCANQGSQWYNRWGLTTSSGFTGWVDIPTDCVFGKTTTINGIVKHTFADTDWSSNTQSINIGRGRNATSNVRIYSCKLYDDTTLVRDFIPCIRIADNKPGMYDIVGSTFYVNQGVGEFVTP